MRELLEQIEELCKGLLSPKPKQDAFVAAIKPPTLKVPKMSSGGVSVGKIVGNLPPPSKKDPKKMAEQLKNPNPEKLHTEILKIESNGQWRLEKSLIKPPGTTMPTPPRSAALAPTPTPQVTPSVTIHSQNHGWGSAHHTPEQDTLIHGLNLGKGKSVGSGLMGSKFVPNDNTGNTAIVKNSLDHAHRDFAGHVKNNFNSAKREVLFHNMARDYFGMGHHVPTTAGFTTNGADWSAQKKIEGVSHPDVDQGTTRPANSPVAAQTASQNHVLRNDNHRQILNKLHNDGTLDKLRLMDHLMANNDRHGGNYMLADQGGHDEPSRGLHLIDNGAAFDYGNAFAHTTPDYVKTANLPSVRGRRGHDNTKELHPEALKWLNGLDENKAKELFAKQGYDENSYPVQGFTSRLRGLRDELANENNAGNVEGMLQANRQKTARHNI